ncbi:MAG: hypothetical protein JNL34_12425 [Anaerolineae bacterium]|nr:hypothetical protein [Anaerolineae bacterium]
MTAGPPNPRIERIERAERRLRTPRSAALAGILFSLLFGVCMLVIGMAFPEGIAESASGDLAAKRDMVLLALALIPFAGIAFLWFIGVVRDLLGEFEDQFFSTVFFGSGLLFLAMTFISAALAGGILGVELRGTISPAAQEALTFGRLVMYQISHNYAVRMAGVFMLSLGTIWYRTGLMPRWLALLTLFVAITLIIVFSQNFTVSLAFPAWVLLISIYILVRNRRSVPAAADA